jgi:short-subunit dehydrogenase
MADSDAVFRVADAVEQDVGPMDVWVNDAFSSVFAPFHEISAEEFRRTTEVSYLGFVYGTMAALKHMRPRDKGAIVQVGSALAYRGIPLQSAYCGAKHAIQGFNESLRCELLHDRSGVHVTMVQLPAVYTPQFSWVRTKLGKHAQPVPPIYQPEVPARAIVYASDHPKRREYWVGSTTAATLLANAVVPALLDRYLARTGFQSQQTDAPPPADKAGNLREPLDDSDGYDHTAHGEFDDQAHTFDPQTWASLHHGVVAAGGVLAGAAAAAAWRHSRS